MILSTPIKIYLGTQIEQSLAVDVLTYSIVRRTQASIQITPLYQAVATAGIEVPMPSNPQLRPQTPFTFQRFAIPELCQYRGRAIYLDSDMLVFQDINRLWQQSFERANHESADLLSVPELPDSGRSPQYSVMLLNCDQLKWQVAQLVGELDRGTWTYKQFVMEMAPAVNKAAILPLGWNDLERYRPGKTALLHYTDMPRQPWLSVANPLAKLWCDMLLKAVADGAITRDTVCHSIEQGWVRPSLIDQIDSGIADPQLLPEPILQRDRHTFTPPHIWQKYLRLPALQGERSRRWFSRAYEIYTRLKGAT
ncbi:MAG: LPS:glycosyltransferase [Phormidesmis priestleyi Ana]|uniref:LPS:glycosyltransferase n=1 Tax=Phormidesmis priestleyi Ana TaxID=1666911 RepID=A0A0P7ZSH5_9CYAN|nr:MAG: LPS:glycosyltransferase [Phormidesmis priestleyi Ana]